MTLEQLNTRKAALVSQREQMLANVNAIGGAIQDIDYWIGVVSTPLAPPPESPAAPAASEVPASA